jgi:hypothetical protein
VEPRIRAATGLDSAAALYGGTVPLWNPLITALSTFGYSPKNIFMQSYDWRMSLDALESRDGYFTNLKHVIESAFHQNNKTKVVLVCHSLGGVIFTWFTQFMTARDATWMETHVHANVLLGAPLLGAPKAINVLLSGDMPDTYQELSTFQTFLGWTNIIHDKDNQVMNRLIQIMRSFESLMYLLPKGGDGFWSQYTWSEAALEDDSADLSRLLYNSNPQNMNEVLKSKLCSDASAEKEGPTMESVFGNVSRVLLERQVTALCVAFQRCFRAMHDFI